MSDGQGHLDLAAFSVLAFANDGKLGAQELDHMIEIMERDGDLSDEELRVFRNILRRLKQDEFCAQMRASLRQFEQRHNLTLLV